MQGKEPTSLMLAEAVRITEAVHKLPVEQRATGYRHGDCGYTGYGCRCPTCCAAHVEAQRRYRERRAERAAERELR